MAPPDPASLIAAWLQGAPLHPPDDAAVHEARSHRLGGWLWHLHRFEGLPLPPAAAKACERDWAQNLAGHLRRAQVLAEVWPAGAPAPLIFKGAELAERLYPDPGARAAADLDLLVPQAHHGALVSALRERGGTLEVPRYERRPGEAPYNLGLRFGEVLPELHWAAQPLHRGRLLADDLWPRGAPGRLEGLAVRWPTPLDRVLLWAANQAKDGLNGDLAAHLDLALALRALEPEAGPTLQRAARAAGLDRALEVAALRLARWGWPTPPLWSPGPGSRVAAHLLGDPRRRRPETPWRYQWHRILSGPPQAALATALRWPHRVHAAWRAR